MSWIVYFVLLTLSKKAFVFVNAVVGIELAPSLMLDKLTDLRTPSDSFYKAIISFANNFSY